MLCFHKTAFADAVLTGAGAFKFQRLHHNVPARFFHARPAFLVLRIIHYSGLPGRAYAKLLKEKWTEVFPTGAYWNHTELVSDNRLAAFASDTSTYAFDPPKKGKVQVTVTLLYRRAFIQLMEQKKWDVPDIIMARQKLTI